MGGVAIGGFMGTGKTTVGRRLAAALGLPFVDTDAILVARFGSISEQFHQHGERVFRKRESEVIQEICAGPDAVVATGGGAWEDPANRSGLGERFTRVVLSAGIRTLEKRLAGDDSRPLWNRESAALLARRQDAYRDCEFQVSVDGKSPATLVSEILAGVNAPVPETIVVHIALAERSYSVIVDSAAWGGLPGALETALPDCSRAVVISDDNVAPLWFEPVSAALDAIGWDHRLITFPAGERHKTADTWAALQGEVLQAGFDRKTVVIALGGGVVGDMAGFVAATAMRGVPFVQLPTTLLALVDSSVGGKTGLNHAGGKNLVGAFHQPRLVYGALQALTTLPRADRISGLGEVLKTALLGDEALLNLVEEEAVALRDGDPRVTAKIISECVRIKARIVAEDEREAGVRALLNAGHTVAHAYEAVLPPGAVRHGEAVALGLVAETKWAIRQRHCEDSELADRLARIGAALGLPIVPPAASRDALVAAMQLDKKASADTIAVPVPVCAGVMRLVRIPRTRLHELVSETP